MTVAECGSSFSLSLSLPSLLSPLLLHLATSYRLPLLPFPSSISPRNSLQSPQHRELGSSRRSLVSFNLPSLTPLVSFLLPSFLPRQFRLASFRWFSFRSFLFGSSSLLGELSTLAFSRGRRSFRLVPRSFFEREDLDVVLSWTLDLSEGFHLRSP